jgi:hypothetical protein
LRIANCDTWEELTSEVVEFLTDVEDVPAAEAELVEQLFNAKDKKGIERHLDILLSGSWSIYGSEDGYLGDVEVGLGDEEKSKLLQAFQEWSGGHHPRMCDAITIKHYVESHSWEHDDMQPGMVIERVMEFLEAERLSPEPASPARAPRRRHR